MDYENPNLVTMFVTRDPLSRALAGDGTTSKYFPNIFRYNNGTRKEWERFARGPATNNYALRILSNEYCCQQNNTDRKYLEMAKALVKRFTFVLDIDCLDHGLAAIANILGFEISRNIQAADSNPRHHHLPVKERVPFPDVYEFMRDGNKLGIELHEWAKSRALVDCSTVQSDRRRDT